LSYKFFFGAEQLKAFDLDVRRIVSNRDSQAGYVTIDILDGNLIGQRLKLREA
jgi:hypothetical protein